jgi:hypothetical protein
MSIDGQKNQTGASDDKQLLTPTTDLASSSLKPQDKPTGTRDTEIHSDNDSEPDSETDYETDSDVDEPDCRVIVNVSSMNFREILGVLISCSMLRSM